MMMMLAKFDYCVDCPDSYFHQNLTVDYSYLVFCCRGEVDYSYSSMVGGTYDIPDDDDLVHFFQLVVEERLKEEE